MKLLLNTHILLWALQDAKAFGNEAMVRMNEAEVIYVSSVSIFEVQLQVQKEALGLPGNFLQALVDSGFTELSVDWKGAYAISDINLPGRSMFDRLLLAQARVEHLKLVTADAVMIKAYPEVCLDARK